MGDVRTQYLRGGWPKAHWNIQRGSKSSSSWMSLRDHPNIKGLNFMLLFITGYQSILVFILLLLLHKYFDFAFFVVGKICEMLAEKSLQVLHMVGVLFALEWPDRGILLTRHGRHLVILFALGWPQGKTFGYAKKPGHSAHLVVGCFRYCRSSSEFFLFSDLQSFVVLLGTNEAIKHWNN